MKKISSIFVGLLLTIGFLSSMPLVVSQARTIEPKQVIEKTQVPRPVAPPDLVVTKFQVTPLVYDNKAKDAVVDATFTIANRGKGDTPQGKTIKIELKLQSVKRAGSYGTSGAEVTKNLTLSFGLFAGTEQETKIPGLHFPSSAPGGGEFWSAFDAKATLTVNPTREIPESNYANNTASATGEGVTNFAPQADLTIGNMSNTWTYVTQPGKPPQAVTTEVAVIIKNIGGADAVPTKTPLDQVLLTLYTDRGDGTGFHPGQTLSAPVSQLKAKSQTGIITFAVQANLTPIKPQFKVVVDPNNYVPESDKTNNSKTITATGP